MHIWFKSSDCSLRLLTERVLSMPRYCISVDDNDVAGAMASCRKKHKIVYDRREHKK